MSRDPVESSDAANPSAIVVGGSAGLGWHVARRLLTVGYNVTITGRTPEKLETAAQSIRAAISDSDTALNASAFRVERVRGSQSRLSPQTNLRTSSGDATDRADASRWVKEHVEAFGGLDVLVSVVGRSDRGRVDTLAADKLNELLAVNVQAPLVCCQAALPELRLRRGVIVHIGSLASRLTPRYMGGYITAKHALAGMTRQLRLELQPDGVHVGLVCPGPIASSPSANETEVTPRYEIDDQNVPRAAAAPGGGAKLKGLTPETVAEAVWRCIRDREIEIVLPRKVRWLIALNAVAPSWADRILGSRTS